MLKHMSAGVEIEVKFPVENRAHLLEQLSHIGFREQTPRTFERNLLFDTPDHTLRSERAILRVRRYGEKWVLTHKCLPPNHQTEERHKHRLETETEVADGEALSTIFRHLGFTPTFVYEKWRPEFSDAHGYCVVDETPIGTFAELEGPEEWIDEIASKLGIAAKSLSTLSYGRLFESGASRPAAARRTSPSPRSPAQASGWPESLRALAQASLARSQAPCGRNRFQAPA